MRKEIYSMLCIRLKEVGDGMIKHIDLWNHNVEFIEQEENWARPAVFVEFCPIEWKPLARGVRYEAFPFIKLHVVTDWKGSAKDGSEFMEDSLDVFDLSQMIHEKVCGARGENYLAFDIVRTETNHNHEEIVENIDVYSCRCFRDMTKK